VADHSGRKTEARNHEPMGKEALKGQPQMNKRRRRRGPRIPLDSPLRHYMEYGYLLLGALIIALSFNLFLNPNRIASGGVSGLSTIVHVLWNVFPAYTQWALNIPLFLLGVLLLGKRFGIKTAIGTIMLPLFVLLTSHLSSPTDQPLLAAIYGGIGVGIGLGLVFRGRGSTGGTDVAAQIVHRFTGISLGASVAIFDGLVILTSAFVFSPENALYALIGLFITSKTIDLIQVGFENSKVAFIISEAADTIRQQVLYDLDRGLTELSGKGGYTGEGKSVLMVVIGQREVTRLKQIVQAADPNAFVIISSTSEVFGEGFNPR